ncbi:MAG: hypothetical protein M1402_02465 [Candidatus Thermoplasmatota archaeon]|nr:hypothetical protein [Candidatus Thermoplasmatota archaeon]MCL5666010.1 hypothetical protein [Candidatus Thermoplasmatota archaeon]
MYSFVAKTPSYCYGKHFPDDMRDKGIWSGIKTSLVKTEIYSESSEI